MYQGQVGAGHCTVSPSGWYAYYPSGQSGPQAVPAWLSLYNGTLRLRADGMSYAGLQYNDPNSCARTVVLVAPSGRTCYRLELEGTGTCTARPDAIWPDGTLVVQDAAPPSNCQLQWWPGLAQPEH